jgi:PadR family transcriptional regulator
MSVPAAITGSGKPIPRDRLEAGPRHGYAIMEALRAGSGGQFDLPTGTIYPALRRLERAGLVQGTWSEAGGGAASTS